jgi:hypothetical protein
MRIFAFLLLSISLTFSGCKTKKKSSETPHEPFTREFQAEEIIQTAEQTFVDEERFRYKNCSPILAARKRTAAFDNHGDLIHAEVNGECLDIEIQYSGCQIAKTTLYWEQVPGSVPPEVIITPGVQNSGDCDMLLENKESYDLGSIKGLGAGEVILKVGNMEPIRYLYAPR